MNFKKHILPLIAYTAVAPVVTFSAVEANAAEDVPAVIAQNEPTVVVGSDEITHPLVITPLLETEAPKVSPLIDAVEISVYDSMKAVLYYSPTLRSIRENRVAQQYEVEKAKSGYYPSLDVTGTYGVAYTDNQSTRDFAERQPGRYSNFNGSATASASATLTQILWNGKIVSNTVDYNIFVLESLDNRVYDNATTLALEGLIAHTDIVRTKKILDLTVSYVDKHREILNQQIALSASGIMTEADVTQAQGRLVRATADLRNAENAYKNSVNNYEQLTGHELPVYFLDPSLPQQEVQSPESIISTALMRNPKINALHSDYQAAFKQIDIAEGGYHPEVTLTFGAEYDDPSLEANTGNKEYTTSASATVGVSWNLFNGFATQNTVLAAKARSRMAREDTIAQIDAVKTEAIQTYNDLKNAQELRTVYEDAKMYNLATRDNYLSQFSFGTRSLLDVLDAETELYTTQVQLATSESNIIVNSWRVLALQGTLLDDLDIEPTVYETPLPPASFDFD